MTPVARIEDVAVEYPDASGTVRALDHVTCQFEQGSSTAIVGRSGSGKSTLVTVLALMRTPTAGEYYFEGEPTSRLRDADKARLRRRVGIVFQSFHIDDTQSVLQNVLLPYHWRPEVAWKTARRNAELVLEVLGIEQLRDRRASDLSGGQRQRVAVARAMCQEPALLIADEPTGNLDEATADEVASAIFGAARELGLTLVVVTHDDAVAGLAVTRLRVVSGRIEDGATV